MDDGPLWSKDDVGNYWLVFPNKHALSKKEIKDIFSKFGKVKNITAAGDEKGLRFVQYTVLEDVENAVENLKDHPKVKLVPHRQKNNRNTNSDAGSKDNQSNNSNTQQPVRDNDKKKLNQRKSIKDNNLKNSSESVSKGNNYKSITEQIRSLKTSSTDNISVCSSSVSVSETSSVTSNPPKLISSTSLFQKYKALQTSKSSSVCTVESSSDNTILSNNTDSHLPDELPELIRKPKTRLKCQQKMEFLKAEEVIVGNIPDDYGCAYILHLFEKFDPLAISYMQTVPKSDTRFCHVYFKTLQDSIKAETAFDKYNLSGNKLIVLRPCRLIEETS